MMTSSCFLLFIAAFGCFHSSTHGRKVSSRKAEATGSPFEDNKEWLLTWLSSLVKPGDNSGILPAPPAPEPFDPAQCKPCTCGIGNQKERIIGGKETAALEYPWMVLLTYNNESFCGGSLISDRYVLTAAHCVHGFPPSRLRLVFSEHDLTHPMRGRIERPIAWALENPKYSPKTLDNDVALIRVSGAPLRITPVCLPPPGETWAKYSGTVVGWGVTGSRGSTSSNTLQEVELPIMTNDECLSKGYEAGSITSNMMCAGLNEGGKDSCQGDSGGPMHISFGTKMVVAGVVSWGTGCAVPEFPGVYTRVNKYLDFIKSSTKDSCYCD